MPFTYRSTVPPRDGRWHEFEMFGWGSKVVLVVDGEVIRRDWNYEAGARARILASMTRAHVIVIGVAAVLAGVALFSPHTTEGLGIAAAILTGVFGHVGGGGGTGTPLFSRARPTLPATEPTKTFASP